MTIQLEILIIAIFVSASCAVLGSFLILRVMAMMSDAISHSVLLGIVIAFFIVSSLTSPLLIVGAGLSGLLTVVLVDIVNKKKFIKKDASIGLVFPLLFSIAIIIISKYAGNIHLDIDTVLLGELAFAPFNRFELGGIDIGPKSLYIMITLFIINSFFIAFFYKELKITTFDKSLSSTLGFRPNFLNLFLMGMVSITCVAAFDVVGSILVIAYMIIPPATAYLLTEKLSYMIILSVIVGMLSSIAGFILANVINANIAGSISVMCGLFFLLTLFLAPGNGIISNYRDRIRKKWLFSESLLLVHLSNHEGQPDYNEESRIDHLNQHMLWDLKFGEKVVGIALENGYLLISGQNLVLTDKGRKYVEEIKASTI